MKRISMRAGDQSFDLMPLIAHDLRTPITAIKGLSQLALRRSDLPAPAAHYLATVVEEANQIASLVDDLVLSSRLEHGEVEPRPSNVDLDRLIWSVVDNPVNLDGTSRPLVVPSSGGIVSLVDAHLTARAIMRLLHVAARLARSDESIHIGACHTSAGPEIWISSHSNTSHTIDSFNHENGNGVVRGHRIDRIGPNLGILLATRLVEAQGGRVLSDDSPDGSARFHVVLPEERVP